MRDELVMALSAWEEGALSKDELHSRFPEDDVHSLLALHSSLGTVAITAPAIDADRVWAMVDERLSQARPSLFTRALDALRRPAIAIAASVLFGGGVAYAADIGPVREGVDAVVQEIGRVFGFGSDGDGGSGRPGGLQGATASPGRRGDPATATQGGETDPASAEPGAKIQTLPHGDGASTIAGEVEGRGDAVDGSDDGEDSSDDGSDDGSSDNDSDGSGDDGSDDRFDDVVDIGNGSDDGEIGDVDDIEDGSDDDSDDGSEDDDDSDGGSGNDDDLIDDSSGDGSDDEDETEEPDEPDDRVVRAQTFERAR